MIKYKVYLKSGTVLEIEAELITSNEVFVHFYGSKAGGGAGKENIGSFPTDAIFGFYKSDSVKQANEIVCPINPAK